MIIFQPLRISNVLRVDRKNFFSLVREDDHFYTAELTYDVRQSAAVSQNTNRVKITAYSSFILPERYINDPSNPTETVNSLLTYSIRNTRLQREQEGLVLGMAYGDIFGSIDKRVFTQLSSGKTLSEIPEAKRTVFKTELKSASDKTLLKKALPTPIKDDTETDKLIFSSLSRGLIRKDKIDPAKSVNFFTLKQSKTGLNSSIVEKKSLSFNSKIIKIEGFLSNPIIQDFKSVTYSTSESQDFIQIKTQIKIKKHEGGRVQFRFELLSINSDIPIDVQEYSANFYDGSKSLKFLFYPPEVTSTRTRDGVIFGLKQTNRWGKSVQVYVKKPSENIGTNEPYLFLGNVSLEYGQTGKFFVKDTGSEDRIFRFVCANEDGSSPCFNSQVLGRLYKQEDKKSGVIEIDYTESASHPLLLSVKNLPETSRTVQFMIKNMTKKGQEFKPVGDLIFLSRAGNTSTSVRIPNIGQLRTGDSFQVICKIQHTNGLYSTQGGDIFSFHNPRDRDGDLFVEIINESIDESDIAFDISDGKNESQTQFVQKIMSARGDLSLFQAELELNKDSLDNIVAYQLERVNLSTGLKENLGLISSGRFSDQEQSKKMGIPPANRSQGYRYYIKTLSANPEILFGDYRKEVKDKCETKIYTYFPSKFHNFWALKRGMIPDDNKNILMKSFAGITKTWDYIPSLPESSPPSKIDASRFNQDHIMISFMVASPGQFFDHFVLSKVINGDKIVLDTIHSQFTSEQKYLYRLGSLDRGEISFVLSSIKNDYTISSEIISNSLSL